MSALRADPRAGEAPRGLGGTGDSISSRADSLPWNAECVQGRVADARRSPIAGARVTIHPLPASASWTKPPDLPAVGEARSGADGAFSVCPSPPGGLLVRAVAPGYAPGVQAIPQRGARVEILLDPGGALDVAVLDGRGHGVPEAQVVCTSPGARTPVTSTATTDERGTARFEALPTGSAQILVMRAGVGTARQSDVQVSAARRTRLTVILTGGREITGLVTDAKDRPVAGASVDAAFPLLAGFPEPPAATTDSAGRYDLRVDVGWEEAVRLRARHAGFGDTVAWVNLREFAAGAMRCDLVLGPKAPDLVGRVVRRDGTPVAGASVRYWQPPPGADEQAVESDAAGRFEIPAMVGAAPGTRVVLVASSDTAGVGTVWTAVPEPSVPPGKPIEVVVSGSGSIEGTVRSPSGRPAAGAVVVAAVDRVATRAAERAAGQPNESWTIGQALQEPAFAARLLVTADAEGRYAIAAVPAATYRLTAEWAGFQARADSVQVPSGTRTRVDLSLAEGASIEGVVLDADGRPVPGARIWGQPLFGSPAAGWALPDGRSQADGRFALRGVIADATYTLYASATGFGQDRARDVAAGASGVTFRLAALGSVEGVVALGDGPLASPFTVTAVRQAGTRPEQTTESARASEGGVSRVFESLDGSFVLDGLPSGTYRVSASSGDAWVTDAPASVTVVDGLASAPIRLSLERGGVVRGDVRSADGKPLSDAWIRFHRAGAEPRGSAPAGSARTDAEGAFVVLGLGAGGYEARIESDRAVPWTERVDLGSGEEKWVHFVERPAGIVRFQVEDGQGRPLAGAEPVLLDAAGVPLPANRRLMARDGTFDPDVPASWTRATTADGGGVCTRRHVPPGRYRASATLQGFAAPDVPAWIEVEPNLVTEVKVVLRPAAR